MRYNTIKQLDIANGPGCRVSLFVQGCSFNCPGCFNGAAKDFDGGEEFTDLVLEKLFDLAAPDHIAGLSILGGEPLHPRNRADVLELVKQFKMRFPKKSVWVWTGYLWEDVYDDLASSSVDVLVDGRFEEDRKDLRLQYRGSSNQRVIDVKASINNKGIILYK
jgi:anaerobic ribonucleoside-triphosphate reductase activating protein